MRKDFAGQTLTVNMNDGQGDVEYRVEGYWDVISGNSWQTSSVIAAFNYAMRVFEQNLPFDDEVLYGKVGHLGYLVHVSEIVTADLVK